MLSFLFHFLSVTNYMSFSSETLRLLSISDGTDTLPCSIVLTRWEGERSERGEEVVGHARLMPVTGNRGAAFIESGETDAREIH